MKEKLITYIENMPEHGPIVAEYEHVAVTLEGTKLVAWNKDSFVQIRGIQELNPKLELFKQAIKLAHTVRDRQKWE